MVCTLSPFAYLFYASDGRKLEGGCGDSKGDVGGCRKTAKRGREGGLLEFREKDAKMEARRKK
jgi:hypothetical protein